MCVPATSVTLRTASSGKKKKVPCVYYFSHVSVKFVITYELCVNSISVLCVLNLDL